MPVLPWGDPLTYDDLQTMPDDGHRYELVDGTLIVTPVPWTIHQRALGNLAVRLHGAAPADLEVLMARFDYVVSPLTVLEPDIVVARRADIGEENLQHTPVLVVEVLSPSTRLIDAGTKRLAFEAAGVPHYWMVDPDEPSIVALELTDGAYRETARVVGADEFRTGTPFVLTVAPATLVA